jgi:hypothetical protein
MTSMQFGTTSTVTFWTPTPTPAPKPTPTPAPTAAPKAGAPYSAPAIDPATAKALTEAGDWTGRLLGGFQATSESFAATLDQQASIHYLSGRNDVGAFVRQWSDEAAYFGEAVGHFGNGIGLAADIAEHGVVEGTLRSGFGNVASNVGGAAFALAVGANPLARAAAFGLGAIGGDAVADFYADRFDEGLASGSQNYAEAIANGGSAQGAFVDNVRDNNSWLTADMPWWQRPLQFTVDGVRTFGSDLGVAYEATSDFVGSWFEDEVPTADAADFGYESNDYAPTDYGTYGSNDYGSTDYGSTDYGTYESTAGSSSDW